MWIHIQAIEEVEREVERLLEIDATAEDVQYGKMTFFISRVIVAHL
jgi:TATA-binding protein-associated factor Taf7